MCPRSWSFGPSKLQININEFALFLSLCEPFDLASKENDLKMQNGIERKLNIGKNQIWLKDEAKKRIEYSSI